MFRSFLFIIFLFTISNYPLEIKAAANSQSYISDEIGVTLRSGPTNRFRVIGKLPAGISITVLANDATNGTSQIRTSDNKTGWIKTEYVSNKKTIRALYNEILSENTKLKSQSSNLTQEISDKKDIIKLNDQLQQQISELQNEVDTLTQQSNLSKDRFRSDMFYSGGITVFISMLIGWLISRTSFSRRQRSGWR